MNDSLIHTWNTQFVEEGRARDDRKSDTVLLAREGRLYAKRESEV